MPSINLKNLSPLSQAALTLDEYFSELERLAGHLDHASLDSESGLERARALLSKFGETGMSIGEGVQNLAQSLNEARARAERAADLVSQKAAEVQSRQEKREELLSRFRQIGENVRGVTAEISLLRRPNAGDFSPDDRVHLPKQLTNLDEQLGKLIEDARELRKDAHEANLKVLERDADSLSQSMDSARRKLSGFVLNTSAGASLMSEPKTLN